MLSRTLRTSGLTHVLSIRWVTHRHDLYRTVSWGGGDPVTGVPMGPGLARPGLSSTEADKEKQTEGQVDGRMLLLSPSTQGSGVLAVEAAFRKQA